MGGLTILNGAPFNLIESNDRAYMYMYVTCDTGNYSGVNLIGACACACA